MEDDGDDKDDTKRKSRNLSEKKRRDQFNLLINELSSMVTNTSRKMDKSTVLKSTIAVLRNQNELSVRSRVHEIQEDWKPAFLSNEEFTHIILESVDGFIAVFSLSGHIIYTSGSITSLLGHLPTDLMNGPMTMFELVCEDDHHVLCDVLSGNQHHSCGIESPLEFSVRVRRGSLDPNAEFIYDVVHFVGYFRGEADTQDGDNAVSSTNVHGSEKDSGMVFVGTGRLITPHLISEVTFSCESAKSEFTSRHNLDWKFLALDSRATPIIGYVQLEVVGTSGYDYYHVDDLDKIVSCHEALMEKGEGTSCYYRFLTKGQQWVWLQTRYYISYHQWNSKPEFVVCTHRVISFVDVMIQARKQTRDGEESQDELSDAGPYDSCSPHKYRHDDAAPSTRRSHASDHHSRLSDSRSYQEQGSDSASLSEDSFLSKSTNMSVRSVRSKQSSRHQSSRHGMCSSPRPHHASRQRPESPSHAHSTTYAEPQYMASVPLQPIIQGYAVSPMPAPEVMRQAGSPVTDQVKRKQEELNHLRQLMSQKEEELQQFVMAQSRHNLQPSLLNVPQEYAVPGNMVSSTTQQSQLLTALPSGSSLSHSREYMGNTSADTQDGGMAHRPDSEVAPFQFSQQQAQLLFLSAHSSQQQQQQQHQHQPPTSH